MQVTTKPPPSPAELSPSPAISPSPSTSHPRDSGGSDEAGSLTLMLVQQFSCGFNMFQFLESCNITTTCSWRSLSGGACADAKPGVTWR